MYYTINVSKSGRHLFRTAEDSLTTRPMAEAAFLELTKRFPKAEGFEVTCTFWTCKGLGVFTELVP